MSDLRSQLRDYVESTIERLDADDVVAAVSAGQAADPRPTHRLRPVWVAAGAALLVVLLVGVPLLLFGGGDSTTADQTTTTAPVTSTTQPKTQPVPTTAAPPATVPVVPGVPLGEAVPGFTDAIVMFTTVRGVHNILRWEPSQPAPDTVLTTGALLMNPDVSGLDVSGGWFAEIHRDGDLLVYPVPIVTGGSAAFEVVASDVYSTIWHDTEAGRLAYLACPDPSSGTATLFTLDITNPAAEPILIRAFDQGCVRGDPFFYESEVGDVDFEWWGTGGVAARVFNGDTFESVLIGADGAEIPGGLDTATVSEGPDGQQLDTAGIIASDETLQHASWSPNGNLVALTIRAPRSDGQPGRILRIVDAVTGAIVVEISETGDTLITTRFVWSNDSRFVVYHSWHQPGGIAEGWIDETTGSASLGFYDTDTDTLTTVPLDGIVDQIRIP
jgi:hypothetical protein